MPTDNDSYSDMDTSVRRPGQHMALHASTIVLGILCVLLIVAVVVLAVKFKQCLVDPRIIINFPPVFKTSAMTQKDAKAANKTNPFASMQTIAQAPNLNKISDGQYWATDMYGKVIAVTLAKGRVHTSSILPSGKVPGLRQMLTF